MAALARPIANRAIHLRITPRPSTLGENREILRLLSGFGEIEYYKSLKYEALTLPTAALVIYKENEAALEALRMSPIRFRMGRRRTVDEKGQRAEEDVTEEEKEAPRGPVGTPFGLPPQQEQTTPSTSSAGEYRPFRSPPEPSQPSPAPAPAFSSPSSPDSDPDARTFQITTSPSRRHFRDHINVTHYHGPFALDTKMVGQGDLAGRVPLVGLSMVDWRAVEKPWKIIDRERRDERVMLGARGGTLGEVYKQVMGKGGDIGKRDGVVGKEEWEGWAPAVGGE